MSDSPSPVPLSETELAILELVATGATNREIAHERSISEATVKKHLSNINGKLGTGNRTEAVRRALEHGLIHLGPVEDSDEDSPRAEEQEAQRQAARRLAEELERARQQSRRTVRLLGGLLLLLLLVIAAMGWAFGDRVLRGSATATPAPEPTAQPGQPWTPAGYLPSERDGLALVFADGLYAIGGEDEDGVLADTLRYTRGIVQVWDELAEKPTAVRDIQAVAVQGFIVVPGGCDASGRALTTVELFDTESGRWSEGPPLPEPRCDYALAHLPGRGRIYLFGGRSGASPDSASRRVYSLRLGEDAWQIEDEMARPRSGLAAAVVDEQVHVLGGRDEGGRPQRNHWIFRPGSSPAWLDDTGQELPSARAGQAALGVSVLRRIYLVGGTQDRDEAAALTLDLGGEAGWRPIPGPLQTPRQGAGADLRNAGREIWIAGGLGVDGQRLHRVYLLNQTPLFESLLGAP